MQPKLIAKRGRAKARPYKKHDLNPMQPKLIAKRGRAPYGACPYKKHDLNPMQPKLIAKLLIFPLLMIVLGLASQPSAQAQSLNPSEWYTVVYVPTTDRLHFITAGGEQASIARPQLPDEAPTASPVVNISRNGQYLVIVAPLTSNQLGLGIYDLVTADFTQVHRAQAGERIMFNFNNRFWTLTSNPDSTQMVVGFSDDDPSVGGWRLILFDLPTGNVVSLLGHDDPAVIEAGISPYTLPAVVFYAGDAEGRPAIYFQAVPGDGRFDVAYTAFEWLPFEADNKLNTAPFILSLADIHPVTGEMVTPDLDESAPRLPPPPNGLNFNAIRRTDPAHDVIWSSGDVYHYLVRWAANGRWVLVYSEDENANPIWEVVLAEGGQAQTLNPNIREAYGTSDGYIMQTSDNRLLFTDRFEDIEGFNIFTSPTPFQVVYITPWESDFEVRQIGGGIAANPQAIAPSGNQAPASASDTEAPADTPTEPATAADGNCDAALPARASIGQSMRIVNAPNGIIGLKAQVFSAEISELVPDNTAVLVADGPQCHAGARYWWVNLQLDGLNIAGWLPESQGDVYILEPAQ